MWLTGKLLGLLNRVWDRTPGQFLALCLDYTASSGMTWQVSDGFLTTTVPGNLAAGLSVDLSQYTVASLASFLGTQPGYVVSGLIGPGLADLSALVLLDGSGDPALSNGDHLFGYTNPNWAVLDAIASELTPAKQAIEAMPAEMSTATADGEWLDLQGAYYAVPRLQGEADPQYALRIPATVLQLKCNNIAIELAIESATGQDVTVTDVVEFGAAVPEYNGLITHNGAHDYNASAEPIYNLFDVEVGFDILGGTMPSAFLAVVRVIVSALRAAGTQLRALSLGSTSALSDTLTAPTDLWNPVDVVPALSDTLTAPTESYSGMPVSMVLSPDTLTAPGDGTDDLGVAYTTCYDGLRWFDGSRLHAGGLEVDETISGTILGIVGPLLTTDSGDYLYTDGGVALSAA